MPLAFIGLGGVLCLALGYIFYGKFLGRAFELDPKRKTPAVAINDGQDFVPARPLILMGQHFAAIAAVGPIAGPIFAAGKYGWALSFIWIVLGAIFIGAVHDFAALVASVRHRGRSIAEVVGLHIGASAKKIFLIYIWICLLYIILVFTDLTATAFLNRPELGAQNLGPGVATTSILYLGLALAMGLAMRKAKIPLAVLTILGVGLLLVLIHLGQLIPLVATAKFWQMAILAYCFTAGVIPLWVLLQPRGYLGGFLLYASLLAGILGFLFYHAPITGAIDLAQLRGPHAGDGSFFSFFPFLFTTIACGACSGFHALVATGTTSKQLTKETDARVVGYGGMLLEAFVALVALGAFITISSQGGSASMGPDEIYARGLATFLTVAGIPFNLGIAFGKLAFATFIYDTLDVSARLGRYILQELMGWTGGKGKYLTTLATILIPTVIFLTAKPGAPAAWKAYWGLFGTSNQLLACLTLAGITVWLKKENKNWLVTGIPCLFMAAVTLSSLVSLNMQGIAQGALFSPANIASLLLLALAVVFLTQAAKQFFFRNREA